MIRKTARRFLASEVVQTSAMDCGPAALKSMLAGFGIQASYGRLRELCQTEVDGTSIDTLEDLAIRLGLQAEQVLVPVDHLPLGGSAAPPGLIIVRAPTGTSHLVVLWRRHARRLQVMDPESGRRFVDPHDFLRTVYVHSATFDAATFHGWCTSAEFVEPLRQRLDALGAEEALAPALAAAIADPDWRPMARLDAATRMVAAIVAAEGVDVGEQAATMLRELLARARDQPSLIPARYFTAEETLPLQQGQSSVIVRGAVMVRVLGARTLDDAARAALGAEERAVLVEKQPQPLEVLRRELTHGSARLPLWVLAASVALVLGAVLEVVILRALLGLGRDLGVVNQRLGAWWALVLLSAVLLGFEVPLSTIVWRLGRTLEARLRITFLSKLPRLGDRYMQSRPVSDMADRCHRMHTLRQLPELGVQLLRLSLELGAMAAGVAWLDPADAWISLLGMAAVLISPVLVLPPLVERDARLRTHSGGLGSFYLDLLLGLVPARSHGAARALERAHGPRLAEWSRAGRSAVRVAVNAEAWTFSVAVLVVFTLLLRSVARHPDARTVLLLLYWLMSIPSLAQEFALLLRQWPAQRVAMLRLFEPLGAVELGDAPESGVQVEVAPHAPGVEIVLRGVDVVAAGHRILQHVNLRIAAGEHVAVVGPSGAGKSTLLALLLGWHRASEGALLIDGQPLSGARLARLRTETAWVDPGCQLWNRSLFENLTYGSPLGARADMAKIIDDCELSSMLERLPTGMQSALGEGGGLISGGEGQRVRLGRAMTRRVARLALLDEPFRGLTRERRHALLARVRSFWPRATLVCVTHDISETTGFDRVVVVESGAIVEQGTPAALLSAPSRYRELMEEEAALHASLRTTEAFRHVRLDQGRLSEGDL